MQIAVGIVSGGSRKSVRKWPSLELESLRIRQGNCILSNFLRSL